MGVTGFARWMNAPTTGLDLIHQNILRNHQGQVRGKWHLSAKSLRSTLSATPGYHVPSERTMCALTMNDNVFVSVEDPAAPSRADILAYQPSEGQVPLPLTGPGAPAHFRTTFLTLSPPGALEQFLSQLRARWTSSKGTSATTQLSHTAGKQLTVDGLVYAIGPDFIVRAGNVILVGGAVKGMLLEAEYLPLPVMPQDMDTMELLTNLLVSILPEDPDAKTAAITASNSIWEDVLWDREQEEEELANPKPPETDDSEQVFVCGDEDMTTYRKGDWSGVDRDRRSAYLIIGALKGEGLL